MEAMPNGRLWIEKRPSLSDGIHDLTVASRGIVVVVVVVVVI